MAHTVRLALLALPFLAGCGAGTAAIASGGGDSGGAANAPPVLSSFAIESPQVSPARVRFVLSDREGDPARVALSYSIGGKPSQLITQLEDLPGNPAECATSEDGITYDVPWNFAAEEGLPKDGSFTDDVRVTAVLENGIQELVLGANGDFGLGNDPPEIATATVPTIEVDGTVGIAFIVSDTSDDVVRIRIEYDIIGDAPDLGWQPARPALDASTPDFAFEGVVADRKGTALEFFWDTDFDLAELEHDVRLRLTAFDPVLYGESFETATFHVDNNAEPTALLNNAAWVLNPDQRRGIRIPYRVTDDEEDDVTVAFQWRRLGESFVELPDDSESVHAILEDAELRAQYRVCSKYRTYFTGSVIPVDRTHVRLPELASSAAGLMAHGTDGFVGRQVELVRGSQVPVSAASQWRENSIVHPVAALPIEDGVHAIVLDRSAPGTWRLLDVELATGLVAETAIAAGDGEPNVMVHELGERSVLIATDSAGQWELTRIDLSNGIATSIVKGADGPIRGLASLGKHAALATAGDSLLRLDWSDTTAPIVSVVMSDLESPWGIALDPRDSNRLYLAERDAVTPNATGRVLSIELDTHARQSIAAQPIPILFDVLDAAFTRPQDLAVNRSGTRLFVITQREPRAGTRELRGLLLRGHGANRGFELVAGLPDSARAVGVGRDDCVLVSTPTERDLLVGGGVRARATIDAYDASRTEVAVSPGFAEAVQPLDRWRIEVSARDSEPASGVTRQFVWDTADVDVGGEYLVRAVPLDAEIGVASEADKSRAVRVPFDGEVEEFGDFPPANFFPCIDAADLDRDGDQDLYGIAANQIVVFLQSADGTFPTTPLALGGIPITQGAWHVVAADLDGDDDLDLCSANIDNDALAIFFQIGPGAFTPAPTFVGDSTTLDRPNLVVAADLDQDGDLDLCTGSASLQMGGLFVFFQEADGELSRTPLMVNGPEVSGVSCVTADDFNGDGAIDLCYGADKRYLRFQVSPGVFSPEPVVVNEDPATGSITHLQSGDLDGDGDVDLCSVNGSATVSIHFQSSPGVFASEPVLLSGLSINDFVQRVRLADLDADGHLDICTGNMGSNCVKVFFQTRAGVFADDPIVLSTSWTTYGPQSVTAADLDNDGDLDLCTANPYLTTYWTIYYQTSPGNFDAPPHMLGGSTTTNLPLAVAAADLDKDGDMDLCSANRGENQLTSSLAIFRQSSPGVFLNEPLTLPSSGNALGPVFVTAADLDGDTDLDLCAATSAHTLAVYFQTEAGAFTSEPMILGSELESFGPDHVVAADLNGDGRLDLCSTGGENDTLAMFFQTDAGIFANEPVLVGDTTIPHGAGHVIAADLDGDGDPDLCSANQTSSTLTIYFQTSKGRFSSTPVVVGGPSTTPDPACVIAADLDGDGDLDLCTANWESTTLSVFLQISPGQFSSEPQLLGGLKFVTERPISVAAADFDADGDLDLCSANSWSNNLSVYSQTTPGVFSKTPRILAEPQATGSVTWVIAPDLDGDGDPDLCSVSLTDRLAIFWNTH